MSFLFPSTKRGISSQVSHDKSINRLFLAISIFFLSAESTTKIMQSAVEQYFSQDSRNLLWPPKSQNLKVTLPFFTYLIFTPTVGIVSLLNYPVYRELIRVDFPASCKPTIANSKSFAKNLFLNQSKTFLKKYICYLFIY